MPNAPTHMGYVDPILESLTRTHEPLLGGTRLWKLLGYSSAAAFNKAVERNTVPVPTFRIPHRRGRFARTHDVVRWLIAVSAGASARATNMPV
jgi:hypothetical protein